MRFADLICQPGRFRLCCGAGLRSRAHGAGCGVMADSGMVEWRLRCDPRGTEPEFTTEAPFSRAGARGGCFWGTTNEHGVLGTAPHDGVRSGRHHCSSQASAILLRVTHAGHTRDVDPTIAGGEDHGQAARTSIITCTRRGIYLARSSQSRAS